MIVSTKFSVSIHILAVLATTEKEYVSSNEISQSVKTNPVIIRKLMSNLKREGLVKLSDNKKGFKLMKKPSEISLGSVYCSIVNEDVFSIHQNTNKKCIIGRNIQTVLCEELNIVENKMIDNLNKESLEDIVNRIKSVDNKYELI